MTPLLLAAWLLAGPASAEPSQGMARDEVWIQAQRPGWTDDRGYDRGAHERPGSPRGPDPAHPYQYREPEPLPRHGPPAVQPEREAGSTAGTFGRFGEPYGPRAEPAWNPDDRQPRFGDELGGVWSDRAWGGRTGNLYSGDSRSGSRAVPPSSETWADGGSGSYPQYRFRGDPQPGSDQWSARQGDDVYRFRPLTDKELERHTQTRGWRPLGMEDEAWGGPASGPRGLMDALTPPPRTYGFEPSPWQGR